MRTDSTLFTVVTESDRDMKAIRAIGTDKQQIGAIIVNHNERGWVVRLIIRSGSGCIGGKTLSIGWRTDSARWWKTHRNIRKGFLGLEISTSANGPYMGR